MTTQTPLNRHTMSAIHGRRLNPCKHGEGRVPGRRGPTFDLAAFGHALEQRDLAYQLARYATDADIRIVDPDNPPAAPRVMHGTPAIRTWLLASEGDDLDVEVTHLVDGGDRVAYTQRWHHHNGTAVLATSTAELQNGHITTQHTILAWSEPSRPAAQDQWRPETLR